MTAIFVLSASVFTQVYQHVLGGRDVLRLVYVLAVFTFAATVLALVVYPRVIAASGQGGRANLSQVSLAPSVADGTSEPLLLNDVL